MLRLLISVLILAATIPVGCVRRVVSVEQVDKMIKDQVPVGSDKQTVKDFIDHLSINSLKIMRGNFYKPTHKSAGFWDPEKLDELWDRLAELIAVRIVDVESGFLNHNDIFIEFAIDRDGRMIGYTVKMVGEE